MVLPFTPLSLTFHHLNYYVDVPKVLPLTFHSNVQQKDGFSPQMLLILHSPLLLLALAFAATHSPMAE